MTPRDKLMMMPPDMTGACDIIPNLGKLSVRDCLQHFSIGRKNTGILTSEMIDPSGVDNVSVGGMTWSPSDFNIAIYGDYQIVSNGGPGAPGDIFITFNAGGLVPNNGNPFWRNVLGASVELTQGSGPFFVGDGDNFNWWLVPYYSTLQSGGADYTNLVFGNKITGIVLMSSLTPTTWFFIPCDGSYYYGHVKYSDQAPLFCFTYYGINSFGIVERATGEQTIYPESHQFFSAIITDSPSGIRSYDNSVVNFSGKQFVGTSKGSNINSGNAIANFVP